MTQAAKRFAALHMQPWLDRAVQAAAELGVSLDAAARTEPASTPGGLTAREVDVLKLIAAGDSNKVISRKLSISVATVERHIANLHGKIGIRGRAQATAWAMRNGLGT